MTYTKDRRAAPPSQLLTRQSGSSGFSLWEVDITQSEPLRQIGQQASSPVPEGYQIIQSGGFLIAYDAKDLVSETPSVPYMLLPYDGLTDDPLSVDPSLTGTWSKNKFWGFYNHYFWDKAEKPDFQLIPVNQYILAYMPAPGRNTFKFWNFDPQPVENEDGDLDPLDRQITQQDAFSVIDAFSTLLPIDNYLIEWMASERKIRLWSFDPQMRRPVSLPYICEQKVPFDPEAKVISLGNALMEISPNGKEYHLWAVDPLSKAPIHGPIHHGPLPEGFDASADISALAPRLPIAKETSPGTMDFMRDTVDHVVVYMLESRTYDSVVGWLYEEGDVELNFINGPDEIDGLRPEYHNSHNGKDYPVVKVQGGTLSTDLVLAYPKIDPFHGTPDSIKQQWSNGYDGYFAGDAPDMGGYVNNNASGEVMNTFTPEQLPTLNQLAASYALSDAWFSALPGGTDSNRAFALTGSSFDIIMTYEGDADYQDFPFAKRRPSVWKTLWNEGETDWKIYWSVIWMDHVFTYQLYLKTQIAAVDKDVKEGNQNYVAYIDEFYKDAAAGTLPKFSFMEPVWIAPDGATSYHPGASGDMVPGERALMDIYNALRASPNWERTAFVITFSKGGGMYDHVSPPKTVSGFPHDDNDGFKFDVLGPRVPTIVISPRVKENTVFRSGSETPLSATSSVATTLDWMGIPRTRWGLGDRMPRSDTFEEVFQLGQMRTDWPQLVTPYDKTFPEREWERTPSETVIYTLEPKEKIIDLYPPAEFANANLGLKNLSDVIAHYTTQSLGVDEMPQCRCEVTETGSGFEVTLIGRAPKVQLEAFAKRHMEIFSDKAAFKAINGKAELERLGVWNPMKGYHVNSSPTDGECKWHLFPPLGLNMIGQKGILLMHYPPWQVIQDGTMLDCMTMSRWNTVLEAAGFDAEEAGQYRTIVDVNPIAAPGSGQSEYPNDYLPIMMASGFFDDSTGKNPDLDYIRSMLELYLNPPGHEDSKYTLPLLVCGSPLYDPQAPGWFKAAFAPYMPLDKDGVPQNNVLQTGEIWLHPNSKKPTPYLIANHMIAAGVTGECTNDPSQIPDIRKYEAQDLVAASFLKAYAADPNISPEAAKEAACKRWFGNATGDGAPKPAKEDDQAAICALAQRDLFFVPEPWPHPKYSYSQALDRCKTTDNNPCASPIAPTGSKNAMGCGCGCTSE